MKGKTGVQSSLTTDVAMPVQKTSEPLTSKTTSADANLPTLIDFSKSNAVRFQVDKQKVQDLITQQRTNLAEVSYLDLNSIANIIKALKILYQM